MGTWEVMSRNSLSILNSAEHFIVGVRMLLSDVMGHMQSTEWGEKDLKDLNEHTRIYSWSKLTAGHVHSFRSNYLQIMIHWVNVLLCKLDPSI